MSIMRPFLKPGSRHSVVKGVKRVLHAQGFWPEYLGYSKIYGVALEAAVRYFQTTHIDPKSGKQLDIDAMIGPGTWRALLAPDGKAQKNFLGDKALIPYGLPELRHWVLLIARKEHARKVREIPNGSNWGDGVIKYGGQPGWAWCMLFVAWVLRQVKEQIHSASRGVAQEITYGRMVSTYGRMASTSSFWREAKKRLEFVPVRDWQVYPPEPGDILLWQHKNSKGKWTGTGHVAFILRIQKKSGLWLFNTIEGNCGNRVKVGLRDSKSKDLIGYVNPYPDSQFGKKWERGIIKLEDVEAAGTR